MIAWAIVVQPSIGNGHFNDGIATSSMTSLHPAGIVVALCIMRILLALDKFKGSLTAIQASDAVARGLQRAGWLGEVEICPIADGGEGFAGAVMNTLGGEWCEAPVHDAQGRLITVRYGLIQREGRHEAVMEMSAASGLAMVSDLPLDPRKASTRGTGEMMRHALSHGAQRILIGIGGSATNDGGSGMAAALGFRFLDEAGAEVMDLPADLERVCRIDGTNRLACDVVVASDVTNPLLGERGATRIYGPQKGVREVEFFESRLERLADLVKRDLRCDYRETSGAGAAGGLGFGLMSFCGARLECGFDLVANMTGLPDRVSRADIVITGEGKLDSQTLHGKGPMGVASMARAAGKRVAGIGGIIEESEALAAQFDLLIQVKPPGMSMAEAINQAAELLEECVARNASAIMELAKS
ncbi:MAG: glycerate kinase [Verrucomicrobiaceae bacterium]